MGTFKALIWLIFSFCAQGWLASPGCVWAINMRYEAVCEKVGNGRVIIPRVASSCLFLQICMKYGRQRWKLRGRIESSGKQVWDSEETVFLPLLTEFLSIKVII